MPSTSFNVSRIKNAVGNYSRQQILDTMDELLQIIYSENTMSSIVIDPATGMPPYLITTAGTRHYTCPANCRETSSIFVERPIRQYSSSQSRAMYTEYIFRNARYYKVAITSTPALINTLATVTFIDDPGTTTDKYFHEYFRVYTALTDETIQIPLPEEVHWLLRKGVIHLLRGENYSSGMLDESVIDNIAKKIRNKLNKGDQARANTTPIQEEYLDADFHNDYY